MCGHQSAAFAGEADGGEFHGAGGFKGFENVRAFAGGGDADSDVALFAERLDLAGEEMIEAVIIADGGEGGCIRGEREGGDGFAVADIAYGQFGGEVLGVGGAAAIAEEQDFSAVLDGGRAGVQHFFEIALQGCEGFRGDVDVFGGFGSPECVEVEGHFTPVLLS